MAKVIRKSGGVSFQDEDDRVRIIVSGSETDGRYSLLEWTVAAGEKITGDQPRNYGPHIHRECEEGFFIRSGTLEFLIDETVATLRPGDYVRVPPGVIRMPLG